MQWTFVLKDKGTKNQGWWLKISSPEELERYLGAVNPTRFGKAFENYFMGKDWDEFKRPARRIALDHSPYREEAPLTYAVCLHAAKNNQNICTGILSFETMTALQQLDKIKQYGCIFINHVGGYHADYDGQHQYDFIRKDELVFPDFKKSEIKIEKFPNGTHYYAYIDNNQVRDGDTLKWDTYQDAYEHALAYINK